MLQKIATYCANYCLDECAGSDFYLAYFAVCGPQPQLFSAHCCGAVTAYKIIISYFEFGSFFDIFLDIDTRYREINPFYIYNMDNFEHVCM